MSKVTDFLDEHKIKYHQSTPRELIVQPCPICGTTKQKFYINKDKGLFDCKICGERGNFFQFKALYGVVDEMKSLSDAIEEEMKPLPWTQVQEHEDALWDNEEAIDYLNDRGFSDKTIAHFHLGYQKQNDGEYIMIPHIQDNQLWNIKSRRFKGGDKTFRRVTGQPTVLYNVDNVDEQNETLFVTESETDTIAAYELGITNCVSLTGGAQTFKPEWKGFFAKFGKVYLLLDSDKEGQKGARKLAEKIGLGKTYNIILPVKDVNEFLLNHSKKDMKELIKEAERFEMNDVSTMKEVMDAWDTWFGGEDNELQGLSTGFPILDHFTHGLKAGELIVLTGNTGIGKTTFTNRIVDNIIREGNPVLGFYLEGQINYMIARMVSPHYGIPFNEINEDPERYEKIKVETASLPLHWYSGPQGGIEAETLKEFIPAVVDLYGIKLIVIDNLQKIVRGIDNEARRTAQTITVLQDLAIDMKIPIILLAHPTKIDKGRNIVTMYDLKSSSDIYQQAGSIWVLQRNREERWLTIEKNRMGEDQVDVKLDVDMVLGTFEERDELSSLDKDEEPQVEVKIDDNEEDLEEHF
jgi:archaellum biogenesis ATPase FlaH/5S rRNA maturation endonuclease (ribonuclease M5)/transcription elongation factor Elf1